MHASWEPDQALIAASRLTCFRRLDAQDGQQQQPIYTATRLGNYRAEADKENAPEAYGEKYHAGVAYLEAVHAARSAAVGRKPSLHLHVFLGEFELPDLRLCFDRTMHGCGERCVCKH